MQSNNNDELYDIVSDDEDENESRLSCSLRWLISKAYSNGSKPDYLPCEHFFQNENDERFLSPDIALVLLSGDLYIRAFQYITNQQDQLITYDDLIDYFYSQNIIIDINLLKQDEPLNAHVHLELIEHLMKLYFNIVLDQNLLYQRFERLQLKSVLTLLNKSKQLNTESFLIIWINGICEYMVSKWSQRIPPVVDLRSALIDGTCLCALISYYDEKYTIKKTKNDLNSLRNYLNHYNGAKMTNIFPFTIKHLRQNMVLDLNLYGMLVDLFVLYEIDENFDKQSFSNENEDEENMCTNKSNQTYSIDDDDENNEDGTNEFFILHNNNNEQITTGGILQTSTNHERQMVAPIKSSLKTSISSSTNANASQKKTTFMPTTTTWQRQALSNQTTPMNTTRNQETSPIDDHQLTNEFLAVKMQLEMKKRAIERDKQRLESIRDSKRQTISQEAFKQLLQKKTRNSAALTNEYFPSSESSNTINNNNHDSNNHIRKSQTTSEFRSQPNTSSVEQKPVIIEPKKEESSIVDLSKPMTRDDFLNTLELLKQKYLENTTTPTAPNIIEENRIDEGQRIEQLNSNIGELQQVITSLSVKQEELHNQVVHASGGNISRNGTFSTKSMTFPRRIPSSTPREQQQEEESPPPPPPQIEPSTKTNGLALEIVDDPSASTAIEMERKRELVLQRQQQRLDAFERRRQMREMENLKRDDERRRKDSEDSAKKIEREQRRDEIFRQYLMKKENNPPFTNDHSNGEHPIIKMRPKSSATATLPRPPIEKRQTAPIIISTFGTPADGISSTDLLNNSDLNDTMSTGALSFVRMAELRSNKTPSQSSKIDSRTLPRSVTRTTTAAAATATATTEPPLPLIPLAEPRYPLAKPLSGKSNKQTIVNALTQVILAGRVNDRAREQVCDEIERHVDKVKHFIILFRDSRLQFRGVYAFIPNTASDSPTRIERLYGQGPREITESMVETFYKYNNGSKKCTQVPTKSFSVQCDAITILNNYWTQQSTATKRTTILPPTPSD
ncbi:unnamed protein product [Rotaria magnacalcarata]|uniref:CKK domain-containing protein n=7 Tax=Rotaria magnacalcarata TaxID=392030 RepID=A0A816NA42_9BILA|nr:unnamed protein product [Rotaria magnacalcarata]